MVLLVDAFGVLSLGPHGCPPWFPSVSAFDSAWRNMASLGNRESQIACELTPSGVALKEWQVGISDYIYYPFSVDGAYSTLSPRSPHWD